MTIRFGMREHGLRRLLGERLRRVTDGYYCLSRTSLGGPRHELGCGGHHRERRPPVEGGGDDQSDRTDEFEDAQGHPGEMFDIV